MSDLHESDILAWSERQAALLRRVAAGERVNDPDLDWTNIIDEVESVGSEQLHAVQSLLVQALIHRRTADGWPDARDVPHWRAEAERFRDDAASRFAPSMMQRLDIDQLWRRALRAMPETIDGRPPLPLSGECPVSLAELLDRS